MLNGPFLTKIDSRAEIKGSRDPLGIQPIWTRFGRCVIGNLTMASSSVRDFTTLLLGLYFAERISEADKAISSLELFIKWEQLAGYARYAVNKDTFRGIERVRTRLKESTQFTLSMESHDQILADQKIYGLWGLYTIPARSSGLIRGDLPKLTQEAREIVEGSYVGLLNDAGSKNSDHIMSLLKDQAPRIDIEGKHRKLIVAIAKVLEKELRENEKEFYRGFLLYGGPHDMTGGLQRKLSDLIDETLDEPGFAWSSREITRLIEKARSRGDDWKALASLLNDILKCESLLAPTSYFFDYLLGCSDIDVTEVKKRVNEIWGKGLGTVDFVSVQGLREKLGGGDKDVGTRWVGIAEALARGEYDALLNLVLEQNGHVMAMRGGSPWIVRSGDKLDVRYHQRSIDLPKRSDVAQLWRFGYFLDSLRNIALEIKGALP